MRTFLSDLKRTHSWLLGELSKRSLKHWEHKSEFGRFSFHKVLCTFYYLYITYVPHRALSGSDGHNAHLQGGWPARCGMFTWRSPRMLCFSGSCRDSLGSATFYMECFRRLVSPLWSWPVAFWLQRVQKKREHSGEKGGGCYESPVTRLNLAISPATVIDDGPRTNKASVLSIRVHNGNGRAVHGRLLTSEGKEMLHRGKKTLHQVIENTT